MHGQDATVLIVAGRSATFGTVVDTVVFRPPCMLLLCPQVVHQYLFATIP